MTRHFGSSQCTDLYSTNCLSLLSVDDLLYVNETNTCFNAPSTTAVPLPPELLHERFATKGETGDDDAKKPTAGDTFFDSVNGSQKLEWAEFVDLAPEDKTQLRSFRSVDLSKDPVKEPSLWFYLGAVSTETKDSFTADPAIEIPDSRANPEAPRPMINRTSANITTFSTFQPHFPPLIPSTKPNQAAVNATKYRARISHPPQPAHSNTLQPSKAETISFDPSVVRTNPHSFPQNQMLTSQPPPQSSQAPSVSNVTSLPPQPMNQPSSSVMSNSTPTFTSDERTERRRQRFLDQYKGRSVKPGVTPDDNKNYHQCYYVYEGESGECMFIKRKDEIKRHWDTEHKNKYTYDNFDGSRVIPVKGVDRTQYIGLAYGKKWTGPSNPPPQLPPPVQAPSPQPLLPPPLPVAPAVALPDHNSLLFSLPSGGAAELFPRHLFDYPQKKIPQPDQHLWHIMSAMRHDILSHNVTGVNFREEVIKAVFAMPHAVHNHREAILKCVANTPPEYFEVPSKMGYDGAYDVIMAEGEGWAEEWMNSLPAHMRALIDR